jgi:gliding motility-associated-like protein
MKKCLATIAICVIVLKLNAQNLVPNWTFEDTLNCPTNILQIYNAPPWYKTTSQSSPDYFNACTNANVVDVPGNFEGYQYAKTGQAYMGIDIYTKNFALREYMSVRLKDSLVLNKKYCVEFYVSLSDSSSYAIGSMGAYLSKDSITDTNLVLPYSPQVFNPSNNIINDKQNWIKITDFFYAAGGEKYLTIGNFNTDANTDTLYLGGNNLFSYYYIDDVSVYLCDSIPEIDSTMYVPNAFSPNGDGENDVFFIQGSLDELHCEIFTRWGEKVAELNLPKQGWDGRVNGMECNTGVYFYYLTAKDKKGEEITSKGNITLLR